MQVAQYTFQSPSTSQVQVGKLDASSVKQESSSTQSMDVPNKSASDAATFKASQTNEVTPTVSSSENLLDIYV